MNTNENTTTGRDSIRVYIYKNSEQHGPFTVEEALTKEREGTFHATDNAWTEGELNWVPLNTLLRKFGPPPAPPVALPPPPIIQPPPPPPLLDPHLSSQTKVLIRRDGNEFGPYTIELACQYFQAGNIRSTDEAKSEGTSEWHPVSSLLGFRASTDQTSGTLSHLWLWFMITAILAVLFEFSAVAVLTPDEDYGYIRTSQKNTGAVLIILSYASLIASYTLSAVMMYRAWLMIQRPGSQTTPGQAVGFMFIPIFNFYWQFVAIRGLAAKLNKHPIPGQKPVNEGLAIAVCVCTCLLAIPPLAPLAFLGYTITGIIFWKPVAERTKALEAKQARPARTVV